MNHSDINSTDSFTLATYSNQGEHVTTESIENKSLTAETLDYFEKELAHLSGDLELPFESSFPGDHPYIEYRVGSDLYGAYVLYYFHDEVIFSSLMLSGTDQECETELLQVFKFLHLETGDNEDPTEEEIEAVLASSDFDFESISQRPIVFEVPISDNEEELEQIQSVAQMNRHIAAAFFAIQR